MATQAEFNQAAARLYGDALLQLAEERGELDAVEAELKELEGLWRDEPAFAALMSSAAIDSDARRASLKRVFEGRLGTLVFNLLMVLNNKGRCGILPAVSEAYHRQLDYRRGRQAAYVTTAAPLSDQQRAVVASNVKRLTGFEPVLIERVDPAVLGGMVLHFGDRVIDTSLKLRLRRLRQLLGEQMERHLHVGAERFITA